jgi:hypothetical protein
MITQGKTSNTISSRSSFCTTLKTNNLRSRLYFALVCGIIGVQSASAENCKVFSTQQRFSCDSHYLQTKLEANGLELIAVPQNADLELAFERITERDAAGTLHAWRLVGRNNLLAGQEIGYGTYSQYFETHAKAARRHRRGEQQQQQQQGPSRCKEREYRKDQRALAEVLPSLVAACTEIKRLRR